MLAVLHVSACIRTSSFKKCKLQLQLEVDSELVAVGCASRYLGSVPQSSIFGAWPDVRASHGGRACMASRPTCVLHYELSLDSWNLDSWNPSRLLEPLSTLGTSLDAWNLSRLFTLPLHISPSPKTTPSTLTFPIRVCRHPSLSASKIPSSRRSSSAQSTLAARLQLEGCTSHIMEQVSS